MKSKLACLLASFALIGCVHQEGSTPTTTTARADERQALIELSRQKWRWMAERRTDRLEPLFHPSARFVHMGTTMDRAAELDFIRTGRIEYRRADISETSAEMIGNTAIVYSKLRLLAVVGGKEVINPFSVTETYVRARGGWQLAAMSFTRLLEE